MLNLNYPELVNVKGDGYDVMVKPFLRLEEIEIIGKEVCKKKTYIDRISIRDELIIKLCVDEEIVGMETSLLYASGFVDNVLKVIVNKDEIDKFVEHEEKISSTLKIFVIELIGLMKKIKKVPLDKMIEDKATKNGK